MSIDGIIARVEFTPSGKTVLYLKPRETAEGPSCVGQPRMTIPFHDTRPMQGLEIWGSANSVNIVYRDEEGHPLKSAVYKRYGYTTIAFERWADNQGRPLP